MERRDYNRLQYIMPHDNGDRPRAIPFRRGPPILPALSPETSWEELARGYSTLCAAYYEERKDLVEWAKAQDARVTVLEKDRAQVVDLRPIRVQILIIALIVACLAIAVAFVK